MIKLLISMYLFILFIEISFDYKVYNDWLYFKNIKN